MRFFLPITCSFSWLLRMRTASSASRPSCATRKSARADFEQQVHDRNGKLTQESKGSFVFQRPGLFRWVYAKPVDQVIVGDGERVWIHDRDLNQVTVRKLRARSARRRRRCSPARRHREGVRALRRRREGRPRLARGQAARARSRASSACAWASSQRPRAMELLDHFGQTTLLRFSNLQRNPKVDSRVPLRAAEGRDVLGRESDAICSGSGSPPRRSPTRCARSRSTRSSASATCSGRASRCGSRSSRASRTR